MIDKNTKPHEIDVNATLPDMLDYVSDIEPLKRAFEFLNMEDDDNGFEYEENCLKMIHAYCSFCIVFDKIENYPIMSNVNEWSVYRLNHVIPEIKANQNNDG